MTDMNKLAEIDYHQPALNSREAHLVSDNKKLQEHIVKQENKIKKLEADIKNWPATVVAGRDDRINQLESKVQMLERVLKTKQEWISKQEHLIQFQKDVMDSQSRMLVSARRYTEALDDWEKTRSEITGGSDYD